ncbi:MAG TPA: hypothetical protein VJI46_03885 [Candidatus Nanoarchaeia archaeon]|nr:hypothetical protein [Candidatus Nanoarchaeia archaeon]
MLIYSKYGGSGDEAVVDIQTRDDIPGLGGTVVTIIGADLAFRQEKNAVDKKGHETYLRHLVIKKLEDYFIKIGSYHGDHIPRPLGSVSKDGIEACYYEWAFGHEGFPWEISDSGPNVGNIVQVRLFEWNRFVECFNSAGIDMLKDVCDPFSSIAKNLIYQHIDDSSTTAELGPWWKRIDFGYQSTPMDFNEISRFMSTNRTSLENELRSERYEMLELALQYLEDKSRMGVNQIQRLEYLVGDYRVKATTQYRSKGAGISYVRPYLIPGNESLL